MTLHDFFLYAAIAGGVLFVVQLALSMAGAGDADLDIGAHHGDLTGHTSADTAFKLLSLQGLTAFFAMFGLVGLALYEESKVGPSLAVLGGLLGGGLTTWLISRLFRAAKPLEASGTIDLNHALGLSGTVYLGIAPGKPGKVTLTMGGRLLVESCGGDARAAASLLMIEKVEALVEAQVAAIKNLKFDKITVWDSHGGAGGSATANFAASLIKSLPPLHEVAKMAGIELPEYLGEVSREKSARDEPRA